MKSLLPIIILPFIVILNSSSLGKPGNNTLVSELNNNSLFEKGFVTPTESYRPHTFWHWMNGHISQNGITDDLEAMKSAGLGGFLLWNTSEGIPEGPVRYMSDQWWELLEHTISESKRLGLEMAIFNAGGWSSSGGPWVTPDLAMQELVWTEKYITGPMSFDEVLEIPEPALGIERDMARNPEVNKRYYVPREQVRGFYKDIALLAFPTLQSDTSNQPYRIEGWREKAGFGKLRSGYVPDRRAITDENKIEPNQVIELTPKLDVNGRLKWEVPPGNWTLLRIGYQPTGRQNHPGPVGGSGLEIDKLSAQALDFHWKNTVAKYIHSAGEKTGETFRQVHIDSYEVGHQNWNVSFEQDFLHLRGYNIRKYLPTVTGRVVKDVETTERFLWDFRKTLSDLIIKNYFGRVAELSQQSGLHFSLEPYGHYGNTDDFLTAGVPHVPTAEWWAFRNLPYHKVTAKLAASAAHTYDRPIVDSEAFTGPPDRIFEEYPGSMKAQGDYFFCQGVNRYNFHTFAHDPYNKPPGLGLGSYGSRIDRRNTWWPFIGAWLEYISRCQYMLQKGSVVADILYFTGEDAPQVASPRMELSPPPPYGYDYSFCTFEVLEQIEVKDGLLVLPHGMTYRLLVLPTARHMRPGVLETIEKLVASGATVVGPKPLKTPGLEGGEEGELHMKKLADNMWGDCDGEAITVNPYKKGRIYWGLSLDSLFNNMNLPPDFTFTVLSDREYGTTIYSGTGMEYIHRKMEDIDWYFISNQHDQPKTIEAIFRIKDRLPELWNPENGHIAVAPRFRTTPDGRMAVTLDLEQSGSVFVVFRQPLHDETGVVSVVRNGLPANVTLQHMDDNILLLKSDEVGTYVVKNGNGVYAEVSIAAIAEPIELSGPWQVSFPSGWGAPEHIMMDNLVCLTTHDHHDVKHFSGIITYHKDIEIPTDMLADNQLMTLDLGDVQFIAEVVLNGKNLGVLWKEPYTIELTDYLQPGNNRLEVRVANSYVNRLIGDRYYPDDSEWTTKTGSTARGMGLTKIPDWVIDDTKRPSPERKAFVAWKWPHLEDKEPLPSGLIGPVKIFTEVVKQIEFND